MATCKSCGATIRWHMTANGKKMPLDAQPCQGGNLIIDGDTARTPTPNDAGKPTYKSHFATCLHASTHRKKG